MRSEKIRFRHTHRTRGDTYVMVYGIIVAAVTKSAMAAITLLVSVPFHAVVFLIFQ